MEVIAHLFAIKVLTQGGGQYSGAKKRHTNSKWDDPQLRLYPRHLQDANIAYGEEDLESFPVLFSKSCTGC